MGDKTRDKEKTSPGRQTQHPRPDGVKRKTRPERGGHSIPAKMADKTGDKIGDKRKSTVGGKTEGWRLKKYNSDPWWTYMLIYNAFVQ